MIIDASCRLEYLVPFEIHAIFMLRPRSGSGQWIIREEFDMNPRVPVEEYTDFYGNLCQRIIMPKGHFHYSMKCRARVPTELHSQPLAQLHSVKQLPVDVLHYLLPSRYCQSDKLGDLATSIVGNAPSSYQNVTNLRNWIHENIAFQRGTSNSSTSAIETITTRHGVCRDFAHLGIALCRSINVPARMVVGFVLGLEPMDLHAWFEAYIGGQWFTFDATEDHPGGNRLVIAYGQDAADVAIASIFGPFTCTTMQVTVAIAPETENG